MTNEELRPYVGRIVKVVLKNGFYHVGNLGYKPEQEHIWGIMPEMYNIGNAAFRADEVRYVFINLGGE